MANLLSVARPYAEAAFEYAKKHQQIAAWKDFLGEAASVSKEIEKMKLWVNPHVSQDNLLKLFQESLKHHLNTELTNFLALLAKHKRLIALTEIAAQFNVHEALLLKKLSVRVVSAVALSPSLQQAFIRALNKKTQREVSLQCEVDPALLGGAIVYIGDQVVDGSLRGKLSRLTEFFLR